MTTDISADDEFLRAAHAEIARRAHIPRDMYFPASSGRFSDDTIEAPMEWLGAYWQLRRFHAAEGRAAMLARLSQFGQDVSDRADRARGAMVGLAVGDALGVGQQGAARDAVAVSALIGDTRIGRRPGLWMDAAGMAACVAYSLIRSEAVVPRDILSSMNCWYRYGAYTNNGVAPTVGASIGNVLDRYTPEGDLPSPLRHPVNGALRSIAPVVIFYADAPIEAALEAAERLASTISDHPDHVDACKALAWAMHGFLNGRTKQDMLGEAADWSFGMRSSKVKGITNGSFRTRSRDAISSTGDAADTLEAVLWGLWHSTDFREGVLQCVNLGGEAVTIGAVYGQLAGSLYGETAIPVEWIVWIFAVQGFYDFGNRLLR